MTTIVITGVALCTLIAAIMGYTFYSITKQFVSNEQKKALIELKRLSQNEVLKVVTPIRLQAYERLILFLERMNPNNLVLRCYEPGMQVKLLKDVMVQNIRDEFDHNLSQQLYVSAETWEYIRNAKEDMISLINAVAGKITENTTAAEFAGKIFEHLAGKRTPADFAIEHLKREMQQDFRA